MSDALMSAIVELRSQVDALATEIVKDERVARIQKLLTGLNTLEDLCGEPKTTLGGVFNFGSVVPAERPVVSVAPDEFYGLESLVAAKKYLKKPKKAVPFKEIVAAIRAGGGDPGNEEKLKVSLARSTWDIVKIGDDMFGLIEFYPHVKRGGKKKAGNGDPVSLQDSVKVELKDLEGKTVVSHEVDDFEPGDELPDAD